MISEVGRKKIQQVMETNFILGVREKEASIMFGYLGKRENKEKAVWQGKGSVQRAGGRAHKETAQGTVRG